MHLFLHTPTHTTTAPFAFCISYARSTSNYLPITNTSPSGNKHRFLRITSCSEQQQQQQFGEAKFPNRLIIHRRNVLVGLGVLTGFSSVLNKHALRLSMASENNNGSVPQIQLQSVPEFGPQPRPLDSTIRVLVPRSKRSQNASDAVEIVSIDGVEVPNNGPVRFDVYVAKPVGDRVGPDLGEFVGSLVDLARLRVGRKFRKMGLTLGITGLVEEIGAQDCDKIVVSLVPRTGEMIIGGIHTGYLEAD